MSPGERVGGSSEGSAEGGVEGGAARPAGRPRHGLHRVPGPAASVAAELGRRGWHVALVPPASTDAELWDGLAGALGLPAWFGRNLDALDEALDDLVRPTALVLGGWSAYARARPDRWDGLLHLLRDWADQRHRTRLVVLTDWRA